MGSLFRRGQSGRQVYSSVPKVVSKDGEELQREAGYSDMPWIAVFVDMSSGFTT